MIAYLMKATGKIVHPRILTNYWENWWKEVRNPRTHFNRSMVLKLIFNALLTIKVLTVNIKLNRKTEHQSKIRKHLSLTKSIVANVQLCSKKMMDKMRVIMPRGKKDSKKLGQWRRMDKGKVLWGTLKVVIQAMKWDKARLDHIRQVKKNLAWSQVQIMSRKSWKPVIRGETKTVILKAITEE